MLAGTSRRTPARCRSIGARFAHGEITLEQAAEVGCRACASPGGGCQFLGTAATSQVVGEALGLSLAALGAGAVGSADLARHGPALGAGVASARETRTHDEAHSHRSGGPQRDGRPRGVRRLDEPAAAHAGRRLPRRACAGRRSRTGPRSTAAVPRLVDALPNGPVGHPTVRVFLAGGVPEVMLHLRELGLLDLDALTVTGEPLGSGPRLVGEVRAAQAAPRPAAPTATASTRTTSSCRRAGRESAA